MDKVTLAYLAGAMDSDGCFGVKRSTYHMRVLKDAANPTFSERVMLKQVTPQIPELLHSLFGGSYFLGKAGSANGKPLYCFQTTDKQGAAMCAALLPYLRVKKRQAELLLELRHSKESRFSQIGYWFEKEFPDWPKMELITTRETAILLNMKNHGSVAQAVSNGSLLSLPYDYSGAEKPRIPKLLVEWRVELMGNDGRASRRPKQLIAWRQRIWDDVRELNKIGIHGTAIYRREGVYSPA